MNGLEGPRLKLDRAGEHLAAFNAEINEFLASDPYEIKTEANPQTGKNVHRFRIKSDIPPRLGLIAADMIHNIRQALDQLTYQLSRSPDERSGFPIFRAENDGAIRKRTKGVPEEAVEIMKAMQPYHATGDMWRFHQLYYIHQLDIIDKHRTLVVLAYARGAELTVNGRVVSIDFAGPCHDGQIIDVPALLDNPDVNPKIYPTLAIPFEDADGKANQLPLLPPRAFLTRIYDDIRTRTFPPFERFFG